MRFKNRQDAGDKLAAKLDKYRGQDCVVYALPRGGVVVGVEIAEYLSAPMDLVIPRKVGHPNWSEYAICAVSESGQIECNEDETDSINPHWLKEAIKTEKAEAKRRRQVYLTGRRPIDVNGVTAIITDDGIATGLTMIVAIKEVATCNPSKIVVAIPVAPAEAIKKIKRLVDEVIVLDDSEPYLGSVGAYYYDFQQTTDEEVIDLMSKIDAKNYTFTDPSTV